VNINNNRIVTLGEENRYAKVNIKNEECNYGEGDYAVLLQHLLFETDKEYFVKLSEVKGFECIDEIYGTLVEKGNRLDFKVKTAYYALGYGSERRPMLQVLYQLLLLK